MGRYDNPVLKREGFVHIKRAADWIGKHPSTIGRWVKEQTVKGTRDGSGIYVCLESLAKYFAVSPLSGTVLSEEIQRLRRVVIAEGHKQCSSSKAT